MTVVLSGELRSKAPFCIWIKYASVDCVRVMWAMCLPLIVCLPGKRRSIAIAPWSVLMRVPAGKQMLASAGVGGVGGSGEYTATPYPALPPNKLVCALNVHVIPPSSE